MALAAILHGWPSGPVLGVQVGKDPTAILDQYAPANWRDRVTLVPSGYAFDTPAKAPHRWGIALDPHYEAKAAEHVGPGDLLWCVAVRSDKRADAPTPRECTEPGWVV